jgi:hypothetical protein
MSQHAREIRRAALAALTSNSVPVNTRMPLMDIPTRFGLKAPPTVAKRIICLYALTGLANGAEPDLLLSWLVEEGVDSDLLESERRFFEVSLSQQEEVNLSWNQESLIALAWGGGLITDLPFPFKQGDLKSVFPTIPPEVEVDQFVAGFRLRDESELYLQVDIHYCLHWSLRHREAWGADAFPKRPTLDVVIERRHALEWLIGIADTWDDVPLDT